MMKRLKVVLRRAQLVISPFSDQHFRQIAFVGYALLTEILCVVQVR